MSEVGEVKVKGKPENWDESKPWNMSWKLMSGIYFKIRKGKLMVQFVSLETEEQLDNALVEAKKFTEEEQYKEFEAACNGEGIRGRIQKHIESQKKKAAILEQIKKDREAKKDVVINIEQEVPSEQSK